MAHCAGKSGQDVRHSPNYRSREHSKKRAPRHSRRRAKKGRSATPVNDDPAILCETSGGDTPYRLRRSIRQRTAQRDPGKASRHAWKARDRYSVLSPGHRPRDTRDSRKRKAFRPADYPKRRDNHGYSISRRLHRYAGAPYGRICASRNPRRENSRLI